jgi:hypothetical protein
MNVTVELDENLLRTAKTYRRGDDLSTLPQRVAPSLHPLRSFASPRGARWI